MSNALQPHELVAIAARRHFRTFAMRASPIVNGEPLMPNWHIDAMAYKLEQVASGEIKRLVICVPPRCLKSYLVSTCFSAWLLGRDPNAKILCASYASSLAEKLSINTRTLMQSSWYRSVYPQTHLDPARLAKEEFGTTAGGYRVATSVGGTMTGRGGGYIIIDDPLKASDAYSEAARAGCLEWFKTTVHTRLNNPKTGAIILVAQRLHAEDLPGYLIEAGGWDQLILPMEAPSDYTVDVLKGAQKAIIRRGRLLHPERHGPEELERLRREMGERDYEAQFNQAPLPPGGALFKRAWLKRYDRMLDLRLYEGVYQSWDTAYEVGESNDYSVCTTWGVIKGEFHLLDVYRKRLEFPDLQKAVLDLRRRWAARAVVVEETGSGHSLYQNIKATEQALWLRTLRPSTSKEHRASQQSVKFEQGHVWLPEKADWLPEFEAELLAFPSARFDDQVDSVVQFLTAVDRGMAGRALVRVSAF